MRIHTRISLLLLALMVFFIGGLVFSNYLDKESAKILLKDTTKEKAEALDVIMELQGKPLKTYAYDYSYWDAMVEFVYNPSRTWAYENLDVSLATYGAFAAWVYRTDFSRVYSVNADRIDDLHELPIPQEAFGTLTQQSQFPHFFSNTSAGFLEIRGAPIQPSSDVERKTVPQGYYFVARLWGDDYLKELSDLLEGQVRIIPPDAAATPLMSAENEAITINFSRELNGWDGRPVAQIYGFCEPPIIAEMNHTSNRRFLILIFFTVIILGVISITLTLWIRNPLRRLSEALSTEESSLLMELKKENNEFGQLAQLIAVFFEQNMELIREVKDRTLAEMAVRDSEQYLKTLLDSIRAGIIVVEADTHKIADANMQALSMIGIAKEKIVGQKCHGFVCQAEKGKCPVTDLKQDIDYAERSIIRADGQTIPILKSVIPVTRNGKKFLIESFIDITERKKAEKELEDSTARLAILADEQKVLLENARDFIYRHDTKGVFYYTSPSVEQITGYTVREWCTHYTTYLTDNPINKYVIEKTEKPLLSDKPSETYLVEIYHKDGRRVQLEVNEQPYFENGRIAGIVGVARDVTERIRMQDLLKQSEEKYRSLIENISDAVGIVDLEQNIVYANPAGTRITGYRHDELIGMNLGQILAEEDMEVISRQLKSLPEKEDSRREVTIVRKDGDSREAILSAKPFLNGSGKVIGMLGVFSDISELKKAESERKELQDKLERAKRMESLALLAGGVAHDLNNILGPLAAYPEIILMRLPDDSPLRKQVSMIGRSAHEAINIIQDLLSLARRGRYEMRLTDLNEVIEQYLDSPNFHSLVDKNPAIIMDVRLDRTVAPLYGSSTHLMKVVMNLVVNAFDAMPDGGTLTIETSQKHLDKLDSGYQENIEGDYIVLRIRDSGMGMDPDVLKKIFEPYYSTKKMGASGSGLGLAVVYGIIKDHKGYYDVFSKINEGTEFVIYFPLMKLETIKELSPSSGRELKETILVVDDLVDQREVAYQLISSLGYRAEKALNGHHAVEYLKKNKVDLIVMDMIMEPGFDGLDAYQEILKIHPGQKAIILSGFTSSERVARMQELGAGQFVKKPYTLDTISKAIRTELDKTPTGAMKSA